MWEIIARCSQVSGETRRARSFISRRLFESVIRNEPYEINVIDLVSCHSQLLLNKFPYEIIQYPVIVIYYRKRRWHRYNFIYNIIMHFFFELQECSVCVNEGWDSQYFIRIQTRRVYCVLYHFIGSTVKNLGGWG